MSMPSDVTPDIAEAAERMERPFRPAGERIVSQMTDEQRGWAVAAFVAFLGVAFVGPAVGRALKPRSMREKLAYRAEHVRGRAMKAGKRAEKRVRRLGGGSFTR